MGEPSRRIGRRGTTEAFAVAVLVGMVVVTTGAVGVYVLVSEEDTTSTEANFTHQYFDDGDAMLVSHADGESLPAGDILIEGPNNPVTWAAVANLPEDEEVRVGDSVQLSSGNVYGSEVLPGDEFAIYRTTGGNQTEITSWTVDG